MTAETRHGSTYHSRTAKQLVQYLRAEAERASGDLYVSGELLADELPVSAEEFDVLLSRLQGSVPGLDIELWSRRSTTTWRISRL